MQRSSSLVITCDAKNHSEVAQRALETVFVFKFSIQCYALFQQRHSRSIIRLRVSQDSGAAQGLRACEYRNWRGIP